MFTIAKPLMLCQVPDSIRPEIILSKANFSSSRNHLLDELMQSSASLSPSSSPSIYISSLKGFVTVKEMRKTCKEILGGIRDSSFGDHVIHVRTQSTKDISVLCSEQLMEDFCTGLTSRYGGTVFAVILIPGEDKTVVSAILTDRDERVISENHIG